MSAVAATGRVIARVGADLLLMAIAAILVVASFFVGSDD